MTAPKLKEAIEAAQAKSDLRDVLIDRATKLNVDLKDVPESKWAEKVENAFQELEASYLRKVAKALEIDYPEGISDEGLTDLINAEGEKLVQAKSLQLQEEIVDMLSEYLGVEDVRNLTVDEVEALLEAKGEDITATLESTDVDSGKSAEAYTDSKGREFVFTDDAPAAFRCFGIERTQEEWMADKDAMELFVEGDLSFLTIKK
ncbi:MAG: hypothetical protein ABI441_03805 [Flavobacterium sp.]